MSTPLFRHPFGVEAFFKNSLVLAYTAPRAQLISKLPPYLELDTFDDDLGFIAAAFVDTRELRPRGFPSWLGRDFLLAGYRIFVRYRDARGRTLRGLYILRSETDRWQMRILGNIFTSYRYNRIPLSMSSGERSITVSSPNGLFVEALIPHSGDNPPLPENSPFPSWKSARRYSGPLPFTFSFDPRRSEMAIVQGVRQGWEPRPVLITRADIPTIQVLGFTETTLANAFVVSDIPYSWKAARIERLPHRATSLRKDLSDDTGSELEDEYA